jgi:hypothetical protein
MDNSTSNVASISIGDSVNRGLKAIELMHIVAASPAHKKKHAGGPVCKASPDGGCLPTQGSTLDDEDIETRQQFGGREDPLDSVIV